MSLSEIRVNTTKTRTGVGTITYTETGPVIAGIATASNFKTGSTNVHSTGVELTNINTGGATATFGGAISGTTASFSGTVSIGGTLTYEDVTNIDSVGILTARAGLHAKDDSTFYGATSGRNVVWDKSENSLEFGDYTYAKFGASDDLTIFHSTSPEASLINNKTGELRIVGSGTIRIGKRHDDTGAYAANMIVATPDGSVELHNNNSKKIETTSTGIDVTGTAVADALNVTGTSVVATVKSTNNNYVMQLQGNNASDKVYFGTTSGNDFLLANGSGVTERLRITSAGLFGIGITPTAKLHVNGVSTSDIITARAADTNGNSVINIVSVGTAGNSRITFSDTAGIDGWVSYNHSARRLNFAAGGTSPQAYLTSDGEFLIGTSTDNGFKFKVSDGGGYEFAFGPNDSGINSLVNYNRSGGAYVDCKLVQKELQLWSGTTPAERLRIESDGQVNFRTGNDDYSNPDIGGSTSGVSINKNTIGQIYACTDAGGSAASNDTTSTVLNLCRRNGAGDGPQLALDRGGWIKASLAGLSGSNTASGGKGQFAIYTHDYSSGTNVRSERLRIDAGGVQNYTGGSADNRYANVQIRHKTPYSTDGGYPGGSQTSTNQTVFSLYNESYGGNKMAFRSGQGHQFEIETKTRDVGSGSYNDADVYFRAQHDGSVTDRYIIDAMGGHTFKDKSGNTGLNIDSSGRVSAPRQPSFAAYRNQTGWTVNANTEMVFNATRHNIGSHYSTSNGRFTAPRAGSYFFSFWSIHNTNVNSAYVRLYKNGARLYGGDIHFTFDQSGHWDNVAFSQVLELSANDYVSIYNGNPAVNYHGNHWQLFSGYFLG